MSLSQFWLNEHEPLRLEAPKVSSPSAGGCSLVWGLGMLWVDSNLLGLSGFGWSAVVPAVVPIFSARFSFVRCLVRQQVDFESPIDSIDGVN